MRSHLRFEDIAFCVLDKFTILSITQKLHSVNANISFIQNRQRAQKNNQNDASRNRIFVHCADMKLVQKSD